MSKNHRESRKRYHDWQLTYSDGRLLTDARYHSIGSARATLHRDGSWTFTDRKGRLIAGYAPGVLAAVQRDLPVKFGLPDEADERLEALDSRA